MPARSSSLISCPLGQLTDTAPTAPDDLPGLLTCLAQVPDPRRDQGRRHPLAFVLSLAACAVLAGGKSLAAIAEWAADAPPNVLARLGGPCPSACPVRSIALRADALQPGDRARGNSPSTQGTTSPWRSKPSPIPPAPVAGATYFTLLLSPSAPSLHLPGGNRTVFPATGVLSQRS